MDAFEIIAKMGLESSMFNSGIDEAIAKSEEFGTNFGDVLEKVSSVADKLDAVLDSISESMGGAGSSFLDISTGVANIITIFNGLDQAKDTVVALTGAIQALGIAKELLTGATWLLKFAMDALPFMIILGAVAALAAGIKHLWDTNEEFRSFIIGAWEAIKGAGEAVWGWLVKFFTEDIPLAVGAVISFFEELPGKIWDAIIGARDKVVEWVSNLIETAKTEIPKFINSVVDAVGELVQKFLEIGKNIVTGIWEGISSMAQWIKDKVSGFFGGIVDSVKGIFQINSPSLVFANIGKMTGEGFIEGISSMAGAVQDAARGVFGGLSGDVTASVIPSLDGDIPAFADPMSMTATEPRSIGDVVLEGLEMGFAMVSDTILDALPKIVQIYIDSGKVAESTFMAFDDSAVRRNRIFAPTRGEIEAIARSVMPILV